MQMQDLGSMAGFRYVDNFNELLNAARVEEVCLDPNPDKRWYIVNSDSTVLDTLKANSH